MHRTILFAITVVSLAVATPASFGQCAGGSCPAPSSRSVFGRSAPSYSQAALIPQSFAVFEPQSLPRHIIDSPVIHEIKDASGQAWQHRDKTYLEAWIAGRDAGIKFIRKTPGQCSCDDCQCATKATVGSTKPVVESTPEVIDEKPPTAHIENVYDDITPLAKPRSSMPVVRSYSHAG